MATNRIEAFQQAFRNLQLQPLVTPEETANLRVPYGDNFIEELEQLVLDCSDYTNQLIFAGHRGCGKSTLLAEFARQFDGNYLTIFFSISDLIETTAINHINILFAIALQIMAKAEEEKIEIEPDKKERFFNWFKDRTQIEESKIGAELEAGFDLLGFLKSKLKAEATIREVIETKFSRNFQDLIDTLNLIATEVSLACKKDIVVIIDDLDKLDLEAIEKIFKKNIKALLQPNFFVIYTIPIATIRDGVLKKHIEDETSNRIFVMPVLKTYRKGESHKDNTQPVDATINKLQEILRKRIDKTLLADDVLLEIALASGGVIRELVRITQKCCSLVLVQLRQKVKKLEPIDNVQIDKLILQEALDILRNDMTITLSKTDREILQETYTNYRPDDPKQQEFLDLLHNVYVIEYKNTESWYDLHPLVIEQLKLEELI
ncbi:P-loop NTPase fold protein [Okeanomitos corallinicola TIOX110]|uniref:P-loop NTPase fold protein n=1 Tax=Okeanomitos corallinicola TIOX110 TaxID=3133117 RepID=A0ABZ2UV66_9CYAN